MLMVKVVFLQLILLTIRNGQHWLAKSMVSGHPGVTDTDIVLLVDLATGIDKSDVDSIAQLSDDLFSGFTSKGENLRLTPLVINTLAYTDEWIPEKKAATIRMFLKEQFRQRKKWRRQEKNNKLFGSALYGSAAILEKDNRRGAKKVVVLITHGHEGCREDKCLDNDGCYRRSPTCDKHDCKIQWYQKSGRVDVNRFVSTEAEDLKRLGITVITVGVGDQIDAMRLKCWASSPHMSILMKSYPQLQGNAAKEILDLLSHAPEKKTSTKLKWYWVLLVAVVVIVVVLASVLILIRVVMSRWNKEDRDMAPIVQVQNAGPGTRYSQQDASTANYKSIGSSAFVGTSYLLRKPYLEPDLHTASNLGQTMRSFHAFKGGKQPTLARPTQLAASGAAQRADSSQGFGLTGRDKPSQTRFAKPGGMHPAKKAAMTQNLKGGSFIGTKNHRQHW